MHITSLQHQGQEFDRSHTTFPLKGVVWIRTPNGPMRIIRFTPAGLLQVAVAEVEAMDHHEVPPVEAKHVETRPRKHTTRDFTWDLWM